MRLEIKMSSPLFQMRGEWIGNLVLTHRILIGMLLQLIVIYHDLSESLWQFRRALNPSSLVRHHRRVHTKLLKPGYPRQVHSIDGVLLVAKLLNVALILNH